jgi:hypothetical protein
MSGLIDWKIKKISAAAAVITDALEAIHTRIL